MKILLMRHGEAIDDITNSYGGWADDPLTDKGKDQAARKVSSIISLNIDFTKIYTSPLKRAYEVGLILQKDLNIPVEKLEYAAEFNGYGILSGMEKEAAKLKYPDQIELLSQTNEILNNLENNLDNPAINIPFVNGAESVFSLTQRVQRIIKIIESENKDVILVTHGGIIGGIFRLILNQKLQKREDCGWVLLEGENGNYKIVESNGIE